MPCATLLALQTVLRHTVIQPAVHIGNHHVPAHARLSCCRHRPHCRVRPTRERLPRRTGHLPTGGIRSVEPCSDRFRRLLSRAEDKHLTELSAALPINVQRMTRPLSGLPRRQLCLPPARRAMKKRGIAYASLTEFDFSVGLRGDFPAVLVFDQVLVLDEVIAVPVFDHGAS